MDETKQLTRKCYDLDYTALPEEVVDRVKYLTLDYLGVAARGSVSESSRPVQNMIKNGGAVGDGALVIGMSLKAPAPHAALANGAAAHSLELDDVVNEASFTLRYPRCPLPWPLLLSLAVPVKNSSRGSWWATRW